MSEFDPRYMLKPLNLVVGSGATAVTGMTSLVTDTTPQLGGNLDTNNFNINTGVNTITDAKVGEWDTAYSWGDHSTAGYLTNYTVTVGDVTAHQASLSITESQISDLQNYLLTAPVDSVAGQTGVITALSLRTALNVADGATNNTGALADLNTVDTAQIDTNAVTIPKIGATGTPDGTNYLRGDGTWATPAGAGGGISNVLDDITPQLGGTLDANGNIIDMGVNTVTDIKVGQWDTAFGWGDHSVAGYITGYTVTQGDVTAHQAALTITESQISDLQSYLTSAPVDSVVGLTGTISKANLLSALNVADGATANTGALADLNTVNAAQIENGAVTIAKIDATGTANTTTFLRGDGSWVAVEANTVDSVAGETGAITANALRTALNIEDGATADQTGAEIKAAYEAEADTNAFDDAAVSKLAGIEASADVTDATNVAAAGAVMSNTAGITGADQITNMVSLTQAEYDAITPDAATFYAITG